MNDNKLRNISFTSENMEKFIQSCKNQLELLPLYLDQIRNGYELTEEMLDNIDMFDDKSKMKSFASITVAINYYYKVYHKEPIILLKTRTIYRLYFYYYHI